MNEFTLPDLGEGLTEAELVRWLVGVGDTVVVDQPIAEVETAKAVVELPTPYGGTVTSLRAAEGEVVEVGSVLLDISPLSGVGVVKDRDFDVAVRETEEEHSGNVLVGYGTTRVGRRRRGAPASARPLVISPVVRRLAKDHGVDLAGLTGSAAGGVITRADVQRAIAPEPSAGPLPVRERIPLRGFRGAAAEAFTRSRREIPEATTWVDVDATELVALRRELDVGLLALIGRFVVAGLIRHPELNSRVEPAEIVQFDGVNLGLAAQTERGLVVPVVHSAHRLSARGLHGEITRLTEAARSGSLGVADLTGGTFTLNNYGMFGVDGSAPIINHPEAGILGVGRIMDRAWVVDGELAVRKITQLSLAFDHRVCDGGPAAAFLRFVADCIERPSGALIEI
jgi:2-oxoisovalerate dehydrogenase E2 component (dihydrolipoyl transacylase)